METEQSRANTSSLGKERLLRILGVTFGVAVGIGGTIGIGILRIPGSVAAQLGHSGLIMGAWIVSGLYAFAGANTYAELGTMLPFDGGPYVFARRAYGEFGGFLVGWSDWLLRTSSMAYLAVALTEYATGVFSYDASSHNTGRNCRVDLLHCVSLARSACRQSGSGNHELVQSPRILRHYRCLLSLQPEAKRCARRKAVAVFGP